MVSIPAGLTPEQMLELLEQLIDGLWDLRAAKYALLAAFTLAIYDHILTFPREVKHIWLAKQWSAPRAIFLFTRYSTYPLLIGHIYDQLGPVRSNGWCAMWYFLNTYWTYIEYSMMHWLVALRVYAYWGRSRKVFILFVTCWAIAFIATTFEATYWLVKWVKPTAAYDTTLKVCMADAPSWIPVVNIGFLLLEAPAFCLTAYKYRQDSKRVLHTTLINTLMQDGLIYFFIVVALTTGTALFIYFAPLAMSGVPRFLTLGIVDVTVSRLVLSLREAAGRSGNGMSSSSDRPSNGGTAYSNNNPRRGKSLEKPNNYALESFVQTVPADYRQDRTIIIGNPYAYNWDEQTVPPPPPPPPLPHQDV